MEKLTGFVEGMSFEDYAAVDALSGSSLLHIRRSPLAYRYHEDNPQEPTEAMKLGTVIHTAILEPPLLGKVSIWGLKEEQKVRRGQVWEEFRKSTSEDGLIILTKAERAEVAATVEGVYDCAPARKYLCEEGPTEISMFWFDEAGRYWKGRLDKLIRGKNSATIVDLKKTRSCASRRFGSQAYHIGYHIKAAIYASGYFRLTGIMPKFKWIAAESKPPFECAVFRATPDVMIMGGEECDKLVKLLDECKRLDHWPPEQEEEEDLILPDYAMNAEMDLDELAEVE